MYADNMVNVKYKFIVCIQNQIKRYLSRIFKTYYVAFKISFLPVAGLICLFKERGRGGAYAGFSLLPKSVHDIYIQMNLNQIYA